MESKSADLGSLKCKLERRISMINSELLAMLDEYIPVDDFVGYIRGIEAAVDALYGEDR